MMKIFVAFVVIAIAVSAEAYNYTVPQLPCAFELKRSLKKEGKEAREDMRCTINDRFFRLKLTNNGADQYSVYRYDITKMQDGKKMIGVAVSMGNMCQTDYSPMDEYLSERLDGLYYSLFGDLNAINWDNKEEVEYDGKNCTHYDNNAYGYELYVYEEYPYVFSAGSVARIYEWEWEAPLDKFKLEYCEGDFAKTPAAKYSRCINDSSYESAHSSSHSSSHGSSPKSSTDAGSSTQAFATVVLAAIATSLVALF